jgi:hypothetical protein
VPQGRGDVVGSGDQGIVLSRQPRDNAAFNLILRAEQLPEFGDAEKVA